MYVALLREGSQNGNEVATNAKVPSSKVYAALEKLASEGFAQSIRRGNSKRWAALPPDELVERLRKHYNDPLDFLSEELPKIHAPGPSEPFLTVSGLTSVHAAAATLIGQAEKEIHISCWQPEFDILQSGLAAASDRGVEVFGMLYGEEIPTAGSWLKHHYEEIVGDRVRGRLLALVADDSEALVAWVPEDGETTAVRSRNPVMTLVVKEYLHHDSVLQRAQLKIGFEEWDRWWEADPATRAEILGEVITIPDREPSP